MDKSRMQKMLKEMRSFSAQPMVKPLIENEDERYVPLDPLVIDEDDDDASLANSTKFPDCSTDLVIDWSYEEPQSPLTPSLFLETLPLRTSTPITEVLCPVPEIVSLPVAVTSVSQITSRVAANSVDTSVSEAGSVHETNDPGLEVNHVCATSGTETITEPLPVHTHAAVCLHTPPPVVEHTWTPSCRTPESVVTHEQTLTSVDMVINKLESVQLPVEEGSVENSAPESMDEIVNQLIIKQEKQDFQINEQRKPTSSTKKRRTLFKRPYPYNRGSMRRSKHNKSHQHTNDQVHTLDISEETVGLTGEVTVNLMSPVSSASEDSGFLSSSTSPGMEEPIKMAPSLLDKLQGMLLAKSEEVFGDHVKEMENEDLPNDTYNNLNVLTLSPTLNPDLTDNVSSHFTRRNNGSTSTRTHQADQTQKPEPVPDKEIIANLLPHPCVSSEVDHFTNIADWRHKQYSDDDQIFEIVPQTFQLEEDDEIIFQGMSHPQQYQGSCQNPSVQDNLSSVPLVEPTSTIMQPSNINHVAQASHSQNIQPRSSHFISYLRQNNCHHLLKSMPFEKRLKWILEHWSLLSARELNYVFKKKREFLAMIETCKRNKSQIHNIQPATRITPTSNAFQTQNEGQCHQPDNPPQINQIKHPQYPEQYSTGNKCRPNDPQAHGNCNMYFQKLNEMQLRGPPPAYPYPHNYPDASSHTCSTNELPADLECVQPFNMAYQEQQNPRPYPQNMEYQALLPSGGQMHNLEYHSGVPPGGGFG